MIRINLLGKKHRKGPLGLDLEPLLAKLGYSGRAEDLAKHKGVAIRMAVLALGIWGVNTAVGTWYAKELSKTEVQFKKVNGELDVLQKELDSKKSVTKQMDDLQKQEAETKHQLEVINSLSQNRGRIFQTVDSVGSLLTDLTWLDSFDLDDGQARIKGASWDYFTINGFVRSLSENVQFSNVQLFDITAVDNPNPVEGVEKYIQKMKNFSVVFNWKGKSGAR